MNGFHRYTIGVKYKTGWEDRLPGDNTYIHSGSYGDMIFGLPAVIASGGGTYYVWEGLYMGIGKLLEAQPYIKEVKVLSAEEWKKLKDENRVTHDLDKFRATDKLHVVEMHLAAFNLTFDLTQPYIFNIPPNKVAKIVVNDTGRQRFPGSTLDWKLLKPHEKDCVFLGIATDRYWFEHDRPYLNIPWYEVKDIYEFARVIAGADLFVGNMSIGHTIAEGLKIPFALDVYVGRPSYPLSTSGHVCLTDEIFYWYLETPLPKKDKQ
jgi:hypothetical protein